MEGRSKSRKSWREKYEAVKEPRVAEDRRGRGMMLISTPGELDAIIRRVKKGNLVTVAQIMDSLADEHGADLTCPMTTGIFIRIVAEVAEEDLQEGKRRVTPYWRVLKAGGTLNPKYPGGTYTQAARLEEEGQTIEPGKDGKPYRVADYQRHVQRL